MLDDFIEVAIGGIGRFIAYVFINIIFDFICYYAGYPIVKIVTFGKYPVKDDSTFLQSETRQGYFVSFVGLLLIIMSAVIAYSLIIR